LSSHLIVQVGFGGTVKKTSNEGLEPCQGDQICWVLTGICGPMSKRFQIVSLKGSTQEKSAADVFRFGYRKVVNDPAVAGVPDPVGSGKSSSSASSQSFSKQAPSVTDSRWRAVVLMRIDLDGMLLAR
jgi:hypothetical protein